MKNAMKILLVILGFVFIQNLGFSQGLPPGWDYNPTPSTHIVSIPLSCNPNINGILIEPGDYIGVFYIDDQGMYACGGATEWLGDQNTGLIAFGDDNFTPEKDGFAPNEIMHYKVYSWDVGHEYAAVVTCNPGLPSSCTNFTSNGLSGLLSLNATGLFVSVTASPSTICYGTSSQLNATVTGGSGNYIYTWSSIPPGFMSNIHNPLVTPSISTQYFVTVSDGTNTINGDISVTVIQEPTANAGNSISICENQVVQLNGVANNTNGLLWSTSGDGNFSNPYILNPTYSLGLNDILNGTVSLTLTVQPISPCILPASSFITVNVLHLPFVTLGNDLSVCENSTVQLTATASNYTSILWSTNGDGTFSNPTILNPVYTPGQADIYNGDVQLTIAVSPIVPCEFPATDVLSISFEYLPQSDAGDDKVICEEDSLNLIGFASNFDTVYWETDGDGTFENPSQINTVYIPGIADISGGTANLTLTAFPINPCSIEAVDQMQLNIVSMPMVFAGNDATICQTGIHQVTGNANNYDDVIWTTSGDGFFGNPDLLSTTYNLGISDIINGSVILLLMAYPQYPCMASVQDGLILNIVSLPQVNAGEDMVICENTVADLSGSAIHYLVIQWTTDGDGTFSNPSVLNPVYTPGTGDLNSGMVHLTLSASPEFPCTISDEDTLLLEIVKMPTANAGQDITIKSGESIQLDGIAQNFSTIEWGTSGDGIFDNTGVLNSVYTPGLSDIANAGVSLSLTSFAILPCNNFAIDDLFLTIDTVTFIQENGDINRPTIFPNPCQGVFTIRNFEPFGDNFKIQVFNLQGSLIFDKPAVEWKGIDEKLIRINLVEFGNGIYLLKVVNNKHIFEHKVIVLLE